jgi:DNA polymerase III alpha subunit
MIYSGHADKVHVVLCDKDDDIDKFNEAMDAQGMNPLQPYIPLDVDQKTFDGVCQGEWFMPDEYKTLNVHNYVLTKCTTQEETARAAEELAEFEGRDMMNLLRYMIYLVDYMRENNIVWGVGRGSSVASYVLYLIGVHRINSIQYDLDWREFLR